MQVSMIQFQKIYEEKENLKKYPFETLNQGDIFSKLDDEFPFSDPEMIACMVLNNTCDLMHKLDKLSVISICPIYKIDIIIDAYLKDNENKVPQNINNGLSNLLERLMNNKNEFAFFLSPILNKKNEEIIPPSYADLSQIIRLDKELMEKILESRIAVLKSPFREKLGWMLGNIFNRIAHEDVEKDEINLFIEKHEVITEFLKQRENKIIISKKPRF
jgi:hypothetical protein